MTLLRVLKEQSEEIKEARGTRSAHLNHYLQTHSDEEVRHR